MENTQTKYSVFLIPIEIYRKILSHTALKIQRLLIKSSEYSWSVKWKYEDYKVKIAWVTHSTISMNRDTLMTGNIIHKTLLFNRNYIYTESHAYCAHSGRLIESANYEPLVSATEYTPKGFVTGWKDGLLSFPSNSKRMTAGISLVYVFNTTVLTGTEEGECAEWNNEGSYIKCLHRGNSAVTAITCDQRHAVFGFSNGGLLCLLRANHSTQYETKCPYIPFSVCLNTEGFIFSGHEDGSIRIWNEKMKLFKIIKCCGVIVGICVLNDLVAVGTVKGLIELYNWHTGELVRQFTEHSMMISRIVMEDNMIISSSIDGRIIFRQLQQF